MKKMSLSPDRKSQLRACPPEVWWKREDDNWQKQSKEYPVFQFIPYIFLFAHL